MPSGISVSEPWCKLITDPNVSAEFSKALNMTQCPILAVNSDNFDDGSVRNCSTNETIFQGTYFLYEWRPSRAQPIFHPMEPSTRYPSWSGTRERFLFSQTYSNHSIDNIALPRIEANH